MPGFSAPAVSYQSIGFCIMGTHFIDPFSVTYPNNETVEKVYMVSREEFSGCFSFLKKMVPPSELMPWVLQTYDDYQESRLWYDILGL